MKRNIWSSKWVSSNERMVDAYCCLSCHHIFTVSLVLCIYTLQMKPLVIHKPDEDRRKR